MQPFLTANWRYLAMLNFVVDPKILAPLVPAGTEIDATPRSAIVAEGSPIQVLLREQLA